MSSSKKRKPDFRDTVRHGINKVLKSASGQSASRQPSPVPALSAQLPSQSPVPDVEMSQAHSPPLETTPTLGSAPAISTVLSSSLAQAPAIPSQSTPKASVTTGVWAGLEKSLRALSLQSGTKLFPPVQSAIDSFVACLDQLSKNRAEREDLALELTTLSSLLAKHPQQSSSGQMSEAVANVVRGIEEQVKIIESRRNRKAGWRHLEAGAEEEQLDRCYRRIGSLFRQLQADANLSMWGIVNDQMTNTRLEGLGPAKLATYNSKLSTSISRRTCTPNTRTTILSGLDSWSCDPNAADLCWMNGMAGTGKTTIACTFAGSLQQRKQLAASFFCTHTSPECRDATRILPTIAYQLARYSVPFQSKLCKALEKDPDASSKHITQQFETLLKEPLLEVKEAIADDLVVVIDALDECDDIHDVELLLSIILSNAGTIPVKFFVTSRPEPEIYARMKARHPSRAILHLHEVAQSLVEADIGLYLLEGLQSASPMPSEIQELTRRSGVLFIYAATLVRYICSRGPRSNPRRRLASVLSTKSGPTKQYSEIDALYAAILNATLDDEDLEDEEKAEIRQVLYTVICSREPIPMGTLTELMGLADEKHTLAALEPLRPVLHFSEITGLITTLHASFPDFMFNKARSGTYFCSVAIHNAHLAQRCFVVMRSQLQFNICKLESSYIPDSEVENLPKRVEQAISPALWYACRYWVNHLQQSDHSDSLHVMLGSFLAKRLLFWLEVLNLKRQIRTGQVILSKGKEWLASCHMIGNSDLATQVEDAQHFAMSFANNPVSQSTPHLYVSSLPFCPKSSFVFKQYYKNAIGLVDVVGSAMGRAKPDGIRVMFGSSDRAIQLWNQRHGVIAAGPPQGHTDWVSSVAYSPDGTRIVSGSRDNTVRVWNAQDGMLVADPLRGHTGWIESVAYSPDGTRIVSASRDNTIRVWNAQDGKLVTGPLRGHIWWVLSVAYSPDGTRIVSGSGDYTIRVWNAQDGTLVLGPLQGHTWWVESVAYSPDGTHIVSGSCDETIRVWNAQNGTLTTGPLQGRTGQVKSAAYSPDGIRIVSGSLDNTIMVWNAQDGTLVLGPLRGHTAPVGSVAYSPDGTRIVSGSYDHTIRVWNAQNGTLVAGPLQGHTLSVRSVTYSPNSTCIVSGSDDNTIRVWNTHPPFLPTRAPLGGDLRLDTASFPRNNETGGSEVTKDRWLLGSNSQLLFWMPQDSRPVPILPASCCTLVITWAGTLTPRRGNLFLGESWARCFQT